MQSPTSTQIRTALVTDLVDSTRMVAAIGDVAAHALFGRHDRLARDLLRQHDGLEIDKSDGFLLLFEHPAQAVGFALAYHQALRALSIETGLQWRARVGIQLGQVYLRENSAEDTARGAKPLEVEGLAKVIAARLMSLAQGGQTLLGAGAFDLAQRSGITLPGQTLGWLAHGRYRVKGLDEPLAVYEVGVLGQAALSPPPDSEKARRDVTEDEQQTLGWRPGPDLPLPGRPHWRLARKLGAGGFGEVWLVVHDDSSAQRVVKFCHDPERLRSLKREVTVFRLLRESLGDRDDIARIIDWQFDHAPFFIESEFIAGGDLYAWAEALGGLHNAPIEQRIEIAAQIADALAAAHSVGVLHKDIKPGNVLIRDDRAGGIPHAVLTDFGIGLVTDKSQLLARGITMAGLTELIDVGPTAGSQLFMAPELLEGKAATTQADLYALGVMLYVLAAGEFKPLAPGWQRDIDCELLAQDIADLVDGDPGRRPASAARVARDLRALPERRARIAAERQTQRDADATRQALLRAQRRRRWAAGLAAALALVATAVGYSAWQALEARDEAELRRTQAERLIGFMLDDFRKKLEPLGRLDLLDAVGTEALAYFEHTGDQRLSDEERHRRAQTLYQLGEVRVQRGELDGAARALDQALSQYRALLAGQPEHREWLFGLGQTEYWRGLVEWRRGNQEATLGFWQQYFDVAQRLVALDPEVSRWRLELIHGWNNLGSVYQAMGRNDEALHAFTVQVSVIDALREQSLRTQDAEDIELLRLAATARNKLGSLLLAIGRPAAAMTEFDAELHLRDALLHREPGNLPLRYSAAIGLAFRGGLRLWLDEIDAARDDLSIAAEMLDQLSNSDLNNRNWARALAAARNTLGRVELLRGSPEATLRLTELAESSIEPLARSQPSYQPWHGTLSSIRATRALALLEMGQHEAAFALLGRSVAALVDAKSQFTGEDVLGEELSQVLMLQGLCELELGNPGRASALVSRARPHVVASLGKRMDPSLAALLLHVERRAGMPRDDALLARLNEAGYPHWRRLLPPRLRALEEAAAGRVQASQGGIVQHAVPGQWPFADAHARVSDERSNS